MITEEQIAFFQAFGFLVLPQAFSPQERPPPSGRELCPGTAEGCRY